MNQCCIFYYLAFSMKARPFIMRCAAFFLMLVFSQKTGAGLFVHNLLHTQNTAGKSSQPNEKGSEISFACSCIDDFLMPLAESAQPVYCPPVSAIAIPVICYRESIPFCTPVLSSLRGPPAAIL
jgi:hypothetical protein